MLEALSGSLVVFTAEGDVLPKTKLQVIQERQSGQS